MSDPGRQSVMLSLSRGIAGTLAQQGGASGHAFTRRCHLVATAVVLANLCILDEGGIVARAAGRTGR